MTSLIKIMQCKHSTLWYSMRGLAAVYLIAFCSFWVQMDGLIGSNGILPAPIRFSRLTNNTSYFDFPSLLLFIPSDLGLHLLCAVGCVCNFLTFRSSKPSFSDYGLGDLSLINSCWSSIYEFSMGCFIGGIWISFYLGLSMAYLLRFKKYSFQNLRKTNLH